MKKRAIGILIFIGMICGAVTAALSFHAANTRTLTEALRSDDPDSKAVDDILSRMTLEEKVGQMFMGCFYDGTPSPETMADSGFGGAVLFAKSFENDTPDSVRKALRGIDKACAVKPLIAVDEEGGLVNRVSKFTAFRDRPFKSPRLLFSEGGISAVMDELHEKNALLAGLGIDVNLAPVCDITEDPAGFMYDRSLGQNADVTSEYIDLVSKACLEDGMGFCLKHFPGYGDSADTHTGIAVDRRPLSRFEQSDLLPFEAGIEAGAPAVLVSHDIVLAIDDKFPSSLSTAAHNMLRYDMGFDGVIITDDLSMGAIKQFMPGGDMGSAAVLAVTAGNDMLCTGDFETQYDALLNAVKNGLISEDRIDNSVRRILKWKAALSLL